jgi:hypothetical protein
VNSFFHLRPGIRLAMQLLERQYRIDTDDDEPLSEEDIFDLRRFVVMGIRDDIIAEMTLSPSQPSRSIH